MKRRIFKLLSILFLLTIFSLVYIYINKKYGFFIPCLFHEITGFYCPGCGVTRMFFSLFKGDILSAFQYNMFVFTFLPFFIFYGMYKIYIYTVDKPDLVINKIPKYIIYMLIILCLLFAVLRNMEAFSFLAPTVH